jgi:hypothetical protein
VPLLRGGQAIGAIVIYRIEPGIFADKQLALLQTFADQAVIAIENVRLFEAEQQRTRVISSSPGELEPVFLSMLANAVRICEAKFGVLYLNEGDAFRVAATHNAPPAFAELRRREPVLRPSPRIALGRAAAAKQAVHIADVQAEPSAARLQRLANSRARWRSDRRSRTTAQRRRVDRGICYLSPRSPPFHRQANRVSKELRSPSRHRH